jgi:hypothetical protein
MVVRENINFERGIDPKKALRIGIYAPGHLFKFKKDFCFNPDFPNVYILTNSKDKKFRTYFYIGRFLNPQNSIFGLDFSFSGKMDSDNSWNIQPIKDDKFEPISREEEKKLKQAFSDPDNESMFMLMLMITDVRPILQESIGFQRGGTETDIKNKIFGFRPGQIIKRSLPNNNSNQNELFVFMKWEDSRGSAINMQGYEIGYIKPIIAIKTSIGYEMKHPARVVLRPRNYPILTSDVFLHNLDEEERKLVQSALEDPSNREHLEKIEDIITSEFKLFV